METEPQVIAVAAGIDGDASPAGERHAQEIADRGLDAAMAKGLHDDAAFPLGVERVGHVLGDAAAAGAEMLADGDGPFGMSAQHFGQRTAAQAPQLARQRERNMDVARGDLGDAVALGAEARRSPPLAVQSSRTAPSRNSSLPEPPAIGEGDDIAQRASLAGPPSSRARSARPAARAAGSRTMPPLPTAARPASNCGLIERDQPCAGPGERKRNGQRLGQRDEAHVGDDGADRLGDERAIEPARVAALERDDARVGREARVRAGHARRRRHRRALRRARAGPA